MIDRSQTSSPVLVDLVVGDGSGADPGRPILYRPIGRLRSPMMARRSEAPRGEGPDVKIPPFRSLVGPLVWAIVPGLPVFIRVGWEAALVVAIIACLVREARLRAHRSTISFGDGFLAYAGLNRWPHGVQEDDDVHWNWSPVGPAGPGQGAGG